MLGRTLWAILFTVSIIISYFNDATARNKVIKPRNKLSPDKDFLYFSEKTGNMLDDTQLLAAHRSHSSHRSHRSSRYGYTPRYSAPRTSKPKTYSTPRSTYSAPKSTYTAPQSIYTTPAAPVSPSLPASVPPTRTSPLMAIPKQTFGSWTMLGLVAASSKIICANSASKDNADFKYCISRHNENSTSKTEVKGITVYSSFVVDMPTSTIVDLRTPELSYAIDGRKYQPTKIQDISSHTNFVRIEFQPLNFAEFERACEKGKLITFELKADQGGSFQTFSLSGFSKAKTFLLDSADKLQEPDNSVKVKFNDILDHYAKTLEEIKR